MREFWTRDGSKGGVLWTNLHGRRVTTGCTDKRAARIWKRAQERQGADPRLAAAEKACLADAIRDLYAELRRRGRSKSTLKRAEQKLGHFPRLWGVDCKLARIDARKIAEYVDARLLEPGAKTETTVARITIRDELAFLRQMLKLARRNGLYPHAIEDVLPIQFETGHKPRKDYVAEDNVPKLLKRVTKRHRAHLLFFCVTGGRLADSYRAKREDFDTVKWRVRVRGSKTEKSWRTIPVPEFLRPRVTELLASAEGEDVLFRFWPNINRDIKAACDRAKIPRVSTNGLRRTFGHSLRVHGFDLDTISKLFGHTTVKLARDVYADVEGDELAEVVQKQEARGARMRYKNGTRPARKPKKRR